MTYRFFQDGYYQISPGVVEEREASIFANGKKVVGLLCTEDALVELAVGFLYNEKVISTVGEIADVVVRGRRVCVELENAWVQAPLAMTVTSGFGGKVLVSLGDVTPVPLKRRFAAAEVLDAVRQMDACAVSYRRTGGIHCSALFGKGGIIASYEDVGRHNTFDKVAGHCLLQDGTFERDTLLATTGRVSSEMVRKASRMGVSLVASHSTPTDAAIRHAEKAGLTIVGYVRDDSFNVYSGCARMRDLPSSADRKASDATGAARSFASFGFREGGHAFPARLPNVC